MKKISMLLLGQLLFICVIAQEKPVPAKLVTKVEKKDTTKKEPFKDWKEVLKDTRAIAGLFQLHLKRDNTLYFELAPQHFGKDFGMTLYYSHGPSEIVPTGLPALWGTRLMRFYRYGDQVALVHYNEKYTAPDNSSMKKAIETGIGHSIIGMFKIESENKENKNILIDVTPFFASDYVNHAEDLKYLFENKPVSFEKEKSFVEKVMNFPRNTEITATISYKAPVAVWYPLDVVADPRFISLGIRYSLFALPEQTMKPRIADDRVGHFITAQRDYSKDKEATTFIRHVNRWRLEKRDPMQALSEPVKPIVFYLHNSIPPEYKKYVKEGIEAWNKGFEKAGFLNAIIAKEQPDDSTWSAEDIRYSTIRWLPDPWGWAIGPSEVDPRTGEILNADILIASGFVNFLHQQYQDMSTPQSMMMRLQDMENMQRNMSPEQAQRLCMAQTGKHQELSFQNIVLTALGRIESIKEAPEKYIGDAIRDLVMHEVGHTLGLRHNFKASSGIPYEKLNDTAFTRKNGLSLSVMDYASVNIHIDPRQQGHYHNVEIGEYDVWAIEYAYTPIIDKDAGTGSTSHSHKNDAGENEKAFLRKIASRANEPLHTYGTDEDNWLGPFAIDPFANAWELSSDPRQFAFDREQLVRKVMPVLESRLVNEGDDYLRLRNAFGNLLWARYLPYIPLTKMIGGMYFKRNHKGDPEEQPSFTPVPIAKQREVMETISKQFFAADAFVFDPQLLNKLAPNRYSHWGVGWGDTPVDFPLLENVNFIQTNMLINLLDPIRFRRMMNNDLRMAAGETNFTPAEMFQSLSGNIWSELNGKVSTINIMRRNLQTNYINQLSRLYTETPVYMIWQNGRSVESRVPTHIRSLVRLELTELLAQLNNALKSKDIDRDTRAHLEETKARIDKVLSASYILPLK
jgi:hypothetical protein